MLSLTVALLLQGMASPPTVRVVASDFEYDAPASVRAGFVTVRMVNEGPDFHHTQMVRLPDDMDRIALRRALQADGPPPEGMVMVGGPGAMAPGDSVEVGLVLEPGRYALLCFISGADAVPHHRKGMLAVLEVTGPAVEAALPPTDVEIRLLDYEFVLSAPVTAGRHTFRIVNEAEQDHEMFIARMGEGQVAQDLLDWIAAGAQGPPPALPLGGVSGLSTGMANTFTVDLAPGNYGLFCFVGDAGDGRPHFMHGMVMDLVVP